MVFKKLKRLPGFSNVGFIASQKGSTLIFVIVISVLASIVISSVLFSSRHTLKKSGARRIDVEALNIAEAGKERILGQLRARELKPSPSESGTAYSGVSFGSGTYTVYYRTNTLNDTIFIRSIGAKSSDSVEIEAIALLTPCLWRNWVKGAVTARTDVKTSGGINIDGRDHDTTGALLGTGGTFGVSTGGVVSLGSTSSLIGGGTTPPQNSVIEGVTVQTNMDTAGYPLTPEEVLGLPAGTLDGFKVSGCPASPFSGITYLESDCSDYTGSGVLICHNSSGTASLKNYHGEFKGLIIADESKHVNSGSLVLGAVIMLGKAVGGNVFGNGTADVLYSSLMVEESIKDAYDIANKRWLVPVVSWKQVK